jgi:hypothetical protein
MEWISVKDSLPDHGVSVLVVDGFRDIWIMDIDENGIFRCPYEGWSMDVTHWMPLPDPPVLKNT